MNKLRAPIYWGIGCALVQCFLTLCINAQSTLPGDHFKLLTKEHVDLPTIVYQPGSTDELKLVGWVKDLNLDLPTNQVLVQIPELARLQLPDGTPFGKGGETLWILPQAQNNQLVYCGISAERLPIDVFEGPVLIQVTRFEGPGYFMVWQATGFGEFNIKVDTRDGLNQDDGFAPLIGSHEHYNWAFSVPGIYSITYQAAGKRIGHATNLLSAESTFVYQVLPLPTAQSYSTWQKHYWPPGFEPSITGPSGDADGDLVTNLEEYALQYDPTKSEQNAASLFLRLNPQESSPGFELSFLRNVEALDLAYILGHRGSLDESWRWQSMELTVPSRPDSGSSVNGPSIRLEKVRILRSLEETSRFFKLKIELNKPLPRQAQHSNTRDL